MRQHQEARFLVITHQHGNVRDERRFRIFGIAFHAVRNQSTMAAQIIPDHGDRCSIDRATSHIERVGPQPPYNRNCRVFRRRSNKERIIPFEAIDCHLFQTAITHRNAGTVDGRLVNHKIVTKLRADHAQRIKPISSNDIHRRVDGIFDEISALATVDICKGLFGVVRIDLNKCANHETVVIVFTKQEYLGRGVVHRKRIITVSAQHGSWMTDTVT